MFLLKEIGYNDLNAVYLMDFNLFMEKCFSHTKVNLQLLQGSNIFLCYIKFTVIIQNNYCGFFFIIKQQQQTIQINIIKFRNILFPESV